jgi:hypothetical protein
MQNETNNARNAQKIFGTIKPQLKSPNRLYSGI